MSDPKHVWLEPECASDNPEGRMWSETPIEDCDEDGCGCTAVRYTRDDLTPDADAPLTVTYTNWRGETAARVIIPKRVWFGATDWHPEPQWLLSAIDVEKNAERDFALKDFGHPDADALVAVAWQMAARHSRAQFDDRGNSRAGHTSQTDWTDGYDQATRDVHKRLEAQTPATARAALYARDDAMRAEGRIQAARYMQRHSHPHMTVSEIAALLDPAPAQGVEG